MLREFSIWHSGSADCVGQHGNKQSLEMPSLVLSRINFSCKTLKFYSTLLKISKR